MDATGPQYFYGAVLKVGFHPKVIEWKTRSKQHYCLIGLSNGGFSHNHEANILARISVSQIEAVGA